MIILNWGHIVYQFTNYQLYLTDLILTLISIAYSQICASFCKLTDYRSFGVVITYILTIVPLIPLICLGCKWVTMDRLGWRVVVLSSKKYQTFSHVHVQDVEEQMAQWNSIGGNFKKFTHQLIMMKLKAQVKIWDT